jgi:hypothetical protein
MPVSSVNRASGSPKILGVTGMSGYLAALLSATRVIGAGRSPEALSRVAQSGAQTVALTGDRETDAAALASALDGELPNLVLDFVWGPGLTGITGTTSPASSAGCTVVIVACPSGVRVHTRRSALLNRTRGPCRRGMPPPRAAGVWRTSA